MKSPFLLQAAVGQARAGVLTTAHGTVDTPAFLPCATHGSLRGVPLGMLCDTQSSMTSRKGSSTTDYHALLANAYHLYLRPGIDTIEELGGLHQFMGWDRTILTDSGGFQAFALPRFVQIEPDGIRFRSHLDGSEHFLTPELVIDIQERLGIDLATCLDVCTGFPETESIVTAAVDQTNEWAERSVRVRQSRPMLLYGMVQGSIYPAARRRSAEFLCDLPFDGFAIGGNMYTFGASLAALQYEKPQMWETIAYTTSLLPIHRPRHLLGVGEPADIIAGVQAGIDTFDCVMATRLARHGSVWIRQSPSDWAYDRINLTAAAWRLDSAPLDRACGCVTCHHRYQRAYLHHLIRIGDPLAGALLSVHNLAFLQALVTDIRQSLLDQTFTRRFGTEALSRTLDKRNS
ncbi:tRNA guanosine(34) transglycosylase Tgt [Candidatus Berkelbacteria bacterium]|nr:tRNA guanosine(34) transglycosylase Tgt [Candidatus Berkelbacteria bacterium]